MRNRTFTIALLALVLLPCAVTLGSAETARSDETGLVAFTTYLKTIECSALQNKICAAECSLDDCFYCTADSPADYVKLFGTVAKALFKGVRRAAVSGMKLVIKSATMFLSNISVASRLVYA